MVAITFSSTYAVTNGDKYVIFRDTKDDAARNQFYPSGSVRAQDLNKNFEQCLMAAEDKVPLFGAVMPDDIDMGGNRITNIKDEYTSSTDPNAADADDAASHGWVRKFFFDVKAETRTGAEYDSEPAATKWPNDDLTVATTSAVNKFIDDKSDALLTNDIHEADGIKVTDNLPGTGQITIGLHDNSVDFSKICETS